MAFKDYEWNGKGTDSERFASFLRKHNFLRFIQ